MKKHLKRAGLLIAGWGFVVLGIAGLFLPVLQGVLFLLVGLTILSTQHEWAHRWTIKLRERFPKVGEAGDKVLARVAGWWQRLSGSPPSR